MKIIAIINQKGGCGKTVTAINLACAVSGINRKTLLLDLDPQAHATTALDIKPEDSGKSSYAIFDAFINHKKIDISALLHKKYDNLFVIGSHISLSTMEQKMTQEENALWAVADALKANSLSDFDYVIIDTPPNLGFITLNAITAANRLIVPIDVSQFSLNGVNHLNEIIGMCESRGYKKPRMSFLVTQFDGRSNFAKNFISQAKKLFGDELLHTPIRSTIRIREAAFVGKAIFEYAPESNAAVDYSSLAYEIFPELEGKNINLAGTHAVAEKPQVMFKLFAPNAKSVYVAGTFNKWVTDETSAMKKLDSGIWIKIIPLPEGTYRYKFVVDGVWRQDPANTVTEGDSMGGKNSVLSVKAG